MDFARRQAPLGDSSLLVELLDVLADLGATRLRETAANTIASRPTVFNPVNVVVPALAALHRKHGEPMKTDRAFLRLWHHASDFLLDRSERPPEPPPDWRHDIATAEAGLLKRNRKSWG